MNRRIFKSAEKFVEFPLFRSTTIDTTSKYHSLIDHISSEFHYCYDEPQISDTLVMASELNESCDGVCNRVSVDRSSEYVCSESVLRKINNCDQISKWFSCSDCIE